MIDEPIDEEAASEAAADAGGVPGAAMEAATEPGEVPLLTNGQLAQVFHDIGDLLEVKGELVFKTVAYHRAADAIGRSPVEVSRGYREGKPPDVPGVGKSMADQLAELATTGRSEYREKLLAEFPTTLLEMLRLPGLGPKTVRLIYNELGVKTLDELQTAAEPGRIRNLRGLSERTEQLILEGIAKPRGGIAGCSCTRRRRSSTSWSALAARRCWVSAGSCRQARTGAGARRSATSTCWPRPTSRTESSRRSSSCPTSRP